MHFVAHLSCSCPSPHRCDACVTALHIHTSAALLFHAQGSDAARARCRLTLFCCAYATRERTCNAARTRGTRGPQIGSFPVFVPLSRACRRSRRDATRAYTSSFQRTCELDAPRIRARLATQRGSAPRPPPLAAYKFIYIGERAFGSAAACCTSFTSGPTKIPSSFELFWSACTAGSQRTS